MQLAPRFVGLGHRLRPGVGVKTLTDVRTRHRICLRMPGQIVCGAITFWALLPGEHFSPPSPAERRSAPLCAAR